MDNREGFDYTSNNTRKVHKIHFMLFSNEIKQLFVIKDIKNVLILLLLFFTIITVK